ncbi:MAG: beta-lactamase protein [Bacteroidetes bacterium]|jgi:uncharacterized NAD(P)/FAD-binding protein YdhS|nr:beta-lactamase protein [Bacteroidota bacterium]MDF2451280.1 beta-lactamase protein [Bacteroidota bacterium]
MIPAIAIIGGGISGTLTVLQCLKQCRKPLSVLWFDSQNKFCKGLAYSTLDENHLLNVRANNMSVFPDAPDHFVNWLANYDPQYSPNDFVPRKIYGLYVQDTFQNFQKTNTLVTVQKIAQEVVSIQQTETNFNIISDQTYQAQKLILALGNFLPGHPRSISKTFINSGNYFQNAFDPSLIEQALGENDITIIGSGLTMIDAVVSLAKHKYAGIIRVISPHGYVPQAHTEQPLPSIAPFLEANKTYTLPELVSLVKFQLKRAKQEQLNPHSVIDAMRPFLQNIWLNFSLEEKQQFLRHLRHKWGVARHRAPVQSIQLFNELKLSHRLILLKGRISDIRSAGEGFEIYYTDSKNQVEKFKTSLLINCTGPEADYNRLASPLIQQMLKDGIIVSDMLKYGLDAQKDGQIRQNLFTLGPALKGILWESVAVPEIRVQAREIVSKIICD